MNKKPIYVGMALGIVFGIITIALALVSFSQQTYLSPREHLPRLFAELAGFFLLSLYFGALIGSLFANKKYAFWVLKGLGSFLIFAIAARNASILLTLKPIAILFYSLPFIISGVIYFRSKIDFLSVSFRAFLATIIIISNILLGLGIMQFGVGVLTIPLAPLRLTSLSQTAQKITVLKCEDALIPTDTTVSKSISIRCDIQVKNNLETFIFNDYLFFQAEGAQTQEQLSSFQEGQKRIRIFFDAKEILSWYEPPKNIQPGNHTLEYIISGDELNTISSGRKGFYILKLLIRPNITFEYRTKQTYQPSDF